MSYTLIGRDGRPYASEVKGLLGGHRRTKVYGTMDCPVALSLLRRGFEPQAPRVLPRRGDGDRRRLPPLRSLPAGALP